MGGCRCTYKNCTSRTDGVTHMFHYPVFDKVRCHQWLTNAQKLEFLNLKVSQLKNRVVCQHHFRDDNFMNFLKDKLTFDAVPTLDGPHCTPSMPAKKPAQDVSKLYSISLEDIENEYLTFNDKKANFSVKYGDFLTNCDLMDLDSVNLTNENTQITTRDTSFQEPNDVSFYDDSKKKKMVTLNPTLNNNLDVCNKQTPQDNTVFTIHLSEVPIEMEGSKTNLIVPNVTPSVLSDPVVLQSADKGNDFPVAANSPIPPSTNKSVTKEKKKLQITILDEQKLSQPVAVPYPVKLEPVCPSAILPLPNKNKFNLNANLDNNRLNNSTKFVSPEPIGGKNIVEPPIIENVKEIDNVQEFEPAVNLRHDRVLRQTTSENKKPNVKITNITPQKIPNEVKRPTKKSNNSLLKTKIPPERVAAIEEKRKFNMKLRDIIASCLDKLDEEDDKNDDNNKLKSRLEQNIAQRVSSYLAKEPQLPSIPDYGVAYLEARIKKMEDMLLHKIDQNSQKIVELKQSLKPPAPNKKTMHSQTVVSEELQKKNLYQEISKYLSPEANSLLYEELFINKYAQKIPQSSPNKKRKYKR